MKQNRKRIPSLLLALVLALSLALPAAAAGEGISLLVASTMLMRPSGFCPRMKSRVTISSGV